MKSVQSERIKSGEEGPSGSPTPESKQRRGDEEGAWGEAAVARVRRPLHPATGAAVARGRRWPGGAGIHQAGRCTHGTALKAGITTVRTDLGKEAPDPQRPGWEHASGLLRHGSSFLEAMVKVETFVRRLNGLSISSSILDMSSAVSSPPRPEPWKEQYLCNDAPGCCRD